MTTINESGSMNVMDIIIIKKILLSEQLINEKDVVCIRSTKGVL